MNSCLPRVLLGPNVRKTFSKFIWRPQLAGRQHRFYCALRAQAKNKDGTKSNYSNDNRWHCELNSGMLRTTYFLGTEVLRDLKYEGIPISPKNTSAPLAHFTSMPMSLRSPPPALDAKRFQLHVDKEDVNASLASMLAERSRPRSNIPSKKKTGQNYETGAGRLSNPCAPAPNIR